ncbi:MAG: transposase [Burkholderiales bacterium]|jgi:transposase|nr:transposase [Burkholderiales bacterium]
MKKQRFSEQFKQDAARLTDQGTPLREVAQSLGGGVLTLDKWVRTAKGSSAEVLALSAEQKRTRELEKENAHLRKINEIIKKAHVYFDNHPNR